MNLHPDTLAALLDRWPIARLATVTPDGAPQIVPVVFVADAGVVYTPVDGKRKSTRALARLANVSAHARVSLLLDRYDEDWARLWWVRLDGPAWIERDQAVLARCAERLRAKYPQYQTTPVFAGEPVALALRWERVRAWAQSGKADLL